MRIIDTAELIAVVRRLCMESCIELDDSVIEAYRDAYGRERSPVCRDMLSTIIENAAYAKEKQMPCCQDTGMTVVFAEVGQEVCFEGTLSFEEAINEGVRQGYRDGYLRKSVVGDPILRVNTNDNTPCNLHSEIIKGDKLTLSVLPKGAGSENMSSLKMLVPADGVAGIEDFILETVRLGGGKPCPPLTVGVGIGGTMDKAAILAKQALRRELGKRNPLEHIAKLELSLLEKINATGIGTLGMGGDVTALDVHIEVFPTHIACLPVAVNLQCHSLRYKTATL